MLEEIKIVTSVLDRTHEVNRAELQGLWEAVSSLEAVSFMGLKFCCEGKRKNQNLREVQTSDFTLKSHLQGRGYLHDYVHKIYQVKASVCKSYI